MQEALEGAKQLERFYYQYSTTNGTRRVGVYI